MQNDFSIKTEIDESTIVETNKPAKVILFNDNIHTFDEVISQLIKAIGCSSNTAQKFANEVHTTGKACVFTGEISNAIKVSHVLEEINLHTQIEI